MKKIITLALAAMMLLSMAACSGNKTAESAPTAAPAATEAPAEATAAPAEATAAPAADVKYKESLVIGLKAQITTMDIQSVSNVAHNHPFRLTHANLVTMNLDNGEIYPDLAESWNWVDNTTIEFKLRDAKFHNGEPVTAQDVVYTFERGRDGIASKNKMKPAKEVIAVDEHTVRMVLESPNVDWLDTIALPVFGILSEKACKADPDKGYMIGAGPFVVDEFVSKDYLKLVRFEDYFEGAVPTKSLTLRYIPEASARLIALQTGEIDVCENPDTIEVETVRNDKNVKLIETDSTSCQFFGFNCKNELTSNKKLRQAIACAVNKNDIMQATVNGYGRIADSFWGPTQFGAIENFQTWPHDIEMAKQLMKEAGFENGCDLEITVASGARVVTAQILQAELKEIGINVKINEVDSAAMTSITNEAKHQGFVFGIAFNTAGDEVRRIYGEGSSTNRSHYRNERVLELMDIAIAEFDTEARKAEYKEIQEIAKDDIPVIPLYYEKNFWAVNKNLGGVTWYASSNVDFSNVYVTVD
ncbi:MAG: ABC transporter substrate-binding protein [Clostridia bacterium]|nr:ABC transporter substrate-binding protein [Clostridia bacterium]